MNSVQAVGISRPDMDTSLRGEEPAPWGSSLANLAELLIPVLDAARAASVVEVGAHAGDLTRELLEWAGHGDARGDGAVIAIEPEPPASLLELAREHPELEVVRGTSHEALRRIPLPDAVIVDGDHNYYTVGEELRILDERASWSEGPLVMFHDVCWPLGRRDAYYAPERVPEDERPGPIVHGARVMPGEPGLVSGGLPYLWAADREGGPRNGVLTAIEDFVADRDRLRLAVVPAFFGLGVLWHVEAPWADDVAAVVGPWDRNPILGRLEANRVFHLAEKQRQFSELLGAQERAAVQEGVLKAMLNSRAFALGEWVSRLRKGGRPAFSREHVRRALGDGESG